MLLQAKKELAICADLHAHDVFFYYSQFFSPYACIEY